MDEGFGIKRSEMNGLIVEDRNVFIDFFIENIYGRPKLSYVPAELCRNILYDMSYQLVDHASATDTTIPLMRMVDCENPLIGSRLRERMEKFESLEVCARFGISWDKFIDQEPWECDEMFRICDASQEKRIKQVRALGDDVKNGK